MEIKGKLVKVLPVQTGQGRNGEWKRQEFIIELDGTYPRKVCISTWGDKVSVESLKEGTMLNVSFDVESREFNGKWYTNLTAWKVETVGEDQQISPSLPPMETYQPDDAPPVKDDLPF
jgi:hypothetical protein